MSVNFPKDLAEYLESEITELSIGTNLAYNTRIKDNEKFPDKMVVIYTSLPRRSERTFCNIKENRNVRAKFIVRSDPNDFETAFNLTELIWDYLQTSASYVKDGFYQDIVWRYSGFEQNEPDEDKRYTFTCEIDGWYNRDLLSYSQLSESGVTYEDLNNTKYRSIRNGNL